MAPIPDHLRATLQAAIHGAAPGTPRRWSIRAMEAYERGAPPAHCVEEAKGKEYGLETGCDCEGCFQRFVFAYLERALTVVKEQGLTRQ
jgi:hypothetical protein